MPPTAAGCRAYADGCQLAMVARKPRIGLIAGLHDPRKSVIVNRRRVRPG
jgi:hypothetical protein